MKFIGSRWKSLVGSAFVAGMLAVAGGPAAPAAAHSALSISSLWCESLGGGNFFCNATASGGSGAYAFAWAGTWNAGVGAQQDEGVGSSAYGGCAPDGPAGMRVTVTDSNGASTIAETFFMCDSIPR